MSCVSLLIAHVNVRNEDALTFEAMDDFMNHVVESLMKYGAQAVRVFPHDSKVLLAFAERLANEVVRLSLLSLSAIIDPTSDTCRLENTSPRS